MRMGTRQAINNFISRLGDRADASLVRQAWDFATLAMTRIDLFQQNLAQRSLIAGTLLVIFILCPAVYSQNSGNSAGQKPAAQTIEDLKSDLDSIMNEISTPGAAVAIVSADSIIWIGTFGFACKETGEPVTEQTLFCIGSCTKSFTGLGFLKLLDEARIDLNTPVREIAPEIAIDNPWENSDPLRIIHLLEHTAGFDDSHPNWFYFDGPILTLPQALEKKAHLRKVRWQPGTRFSYSSAGFALAGYVLEKITGQPYEEYLKHAILIPIGMTGSTIGYSQISENPVAVGYDRNLKPVTDWYDYDVPAGAIYSSIREMALFVRFLLNRGTASGEQIISPHLFDKIGHPVSTIAARSGLKSGYSYGIGTRYKGGAKWLGHSGAVPGFIAEYYLNVDHDLGFVVLQNSFGVFFDSDIFDRVWDYARSQVDSISPPFEPIPCDQLQPYCGYYMPCNPRLQIMGFMEILTGGITISCENDTLYTQGFMENKSPLIYVSDSLFRKRNDPEATRVFARSPDGKMVYASQGSYYEKTHIWKIYLYRFLFFGALFVMMSSIVYALFWIPVHVYKKLRRRANRSKCISMRLVPLLAVLSLIAGIIRMSNQTILEFGMLTTLNMIFFLSTLLFAALSTLSLYTTYRSFYKPTNVAARIYAVLLSAACFGMTLYLGYWGVIGLRLWAY
jgi:CubicO group peptidase (beta-lactamase class C family)